MGLAHSPRIVTDGLVSLLDAGNPKNYNAGISTNWVDKVGGNNGTLNGGTYHTDGPFVGAGYVEFDGTDDHLSISDSDDLTFGSGDYTIEAWIYIEDGTQEYQGIFGSSGTGSDSIQFQLRDEKLRLSSYTTELIVADAADAVTVGQWTHIAISRNGTGATDTRIFKDGTLIKSGQDNITWGSYDRQIGRIFSNTNYDFQGYISNVRVVKGTALYTANFTPPTEPLTNVTNTTLLTCQGNTIEDASSSAHTITTNGNISLTKEPFTGAGAVEFDGTNDYLSVNSSVFNPGTGDFTIEWWQKLAATDVSYSLAKIKSSDGIRSGNTAIQLFISGSINIAATATFTTTDWEHVAIVRSSGVISIYHKGVLLSNNLANLNPANSITASIFEIANSWTGSNYAGSLSNFRVVVGTAVYTSNFTPPTTSLEPIENTTLLTLQGQNIKDASSSANSIIFNGDVKPIVVSSSFEFDGTSDFIDFPASADFALGTGNFTIELWMNSGVKTADTFFRRMYMTDGPTGNATGNFQIAIHETTGVINLWEESGQLDLDGTTDVANSTWNHIAAVRTGTTLRLYVNGVEESSTTYSTSVTANSGSPRPRIGNYNGSTGQGDYSGKISNLRVYKGKGLTAAEVLQNYNALKGRYI